MYIRDHGVGHIHAWYGDDKAVFDIATGALIAGSLKPQQISRVREWIGLREVDLAEA